MRTEASTGAFVVAVDDAQLPDHRRPVGKVQRLGFLHRRGAGRNPVGEGPLRKPEDQLVIQPALAAGTHVILDNAHHKILARYAVNPDVSTSLAEQVFAHLTEPDLVLFLRISARDALARKGEFSSLETGHSGSDDEDFIRYQDIVLAKLREHEQRSGWLSMDVTDMDRDTVFKAAADVLADRLQLAI